MPLSDIISDHAIIRKPPEERTVQVAAARLDLLTLVRRDLGYELRPEDIIGPWPTATISGYVWTVDRDYNDPADRAVLRFLGRCPDCAQMAWSWPVKSYEDFRRLRRNFLPSTGHFWTTCTAGVRA